MPVRSLLTTSLIALSLILLSGCAAEGVPTSIAAPPVQGAPEAPALTPSPQPLYLPQVSTGATRWKPSGRLRWQWQLVGTVDTTIPADVYDIDLFDNDAATVAALHRQGRRVICYMSAGSWEEWRPDADRFPAEVIGNDYEGWPGEKWLDIRRIDLLGPIMRARLDLCKAKGFDAIEPDNIDAYHADTGFPLTAADQLAYNRWLAQEAHARGLSIGLKNDPEQAALLEPHFDWALTESCFHYGWCDAMSPFIEAGKSVFATEYTDTPITPAEFCPQAAALGISAILKHRDLNTFRTECPR